MSIGLYIQNIAVAVTSVSGRFHVFVTSVRIVSTIFENSPYKMHTWWNSRCRFAKIFRCGSISVVILAVVCMQKRCSECTCYRILYQPFELFCEEPSIVSCRCISFPPGILSSPSSESLSLQQWHAFAVLTVITSYLLSICRLHPPLHRPLSTTKLK